MKSPRLGTAMVPSEPTFERALLIGDSHWSTSNELCARALASSNAAAGGAGADSTDGLNIETWTFEIAF